MSNTINRRLAQLETVECARLHAEATTILDACSVEELCALVGWAGLSEEQREAAMNDLLALEQVPQQRLTLAQLRRELDNLKAWRAEYQAQLQTAADESK